MTFKDLYDLQIPLGPSALVYSFIEGVNFLRYRSAQYYMPILFTLYPLHSLNRILARYYAKAISDYEIWRDEEETDADILRDARRTAIISLLIGGVLIPWVSGVLASSLMEPHQVAGFLLLLIVVKAFNLQRAYREYSHSEIATPHNNFLAVCLYATYLSLFALAFWKGSYHYHALTSGDPIEAMMEILGSFVIYLGIPVLLSVICADKLFSPQERQVLADYYRDTDSDQA